jgi:hypothetical protein
MRRFDCPECKFSCSTNIMLTAHRQEMHGMVEPKPSLKGSSEAQFESAMDYRAMRAAKELLSFLDISFPRGRSYANSLEETMAICIKQNMKGVHRD